MFQSKPESTDCQTSQITFNVFFSLGDPTRNISSWRPAMVPICYRVAGDFTSRGYSGDREQRLLFYYRAYSEWATRASLSQALNIYGMMLPMAFSSFCNKSAVSGSFCISSIACGPPAMTWSNRRCRCTSRSRNEMWRYYSAHFFQHETAAV